MDSLSEVTAAAQAKRRENAHFAVECVAIGREHFGLEPNLVKDRDKSRGAMRPPEHLLTFNLFETYM